MNKVYATVWSECRQAWIVTSELASGGGRPKLTTNKKSVILLLGTLLQPCIAMADVSKNVITNTYQDVSGISNNDTINKGDKQDVISGGTANSATITAEGHQNIFSGGSAISTVIEGQGTQNVLEGGAATSTTINESGKQNVTSGGTATSTVVNSGGILNVSEKGSATDVKQQSGGVLVTNTNADVSGTNKNGNFFVNSVTHSTNNVLLENGGELTVFDGGQATGTTINSASKQTVSSGGSATSTIINDGGEQHVENGATVTDTHIKEDGNLYVSSGGSAISTTLDDGQQFVFDGGKATSTVINGGKESVDTGGESSFATVKAGGKQFIDGGLALSTTIDGGEQRISGGTATFTEIKEGKQRLVSGGSATATTIYSAGTQSVEHGGFANSTTIMDGGKQNVSVGGSATATIINAGGILNVSAGGSATGVTQESGGALVTTTDADVSGSNSLGAFFVSSATGSASTVLLENGGQLTVLANGQATDTTVRNEAVLKVNSGGVLSGITTIEDGGILSGSDIINNGNILYTQNTLASFSGNLTGSGRLTQDGGQLKLGGELNLSDGIFLNSGAVLTMENLLASTNVTAESGTQLRLTGQTVLSGSIDPTDMLIESDASWNITGDSQLGTLDNAGNISFVHGSGAFTPLTLTTTDFAGQGGTLTLTAILEDSASLTDRLVIDGGEATGTTNLVIVNQGGLGAQTAGSGIAVIEAINNAKTDPNAFAMPAPLDVGAYRYSLYRNADESWYLTTSKVIPGNSSGGSVTPGSSAGNSSGGSVTPGSSAGNSSGGSVTPGSTAGNSSGGSVTPGSTAGNSSGGSVTPGSSAGNSSGGSVTPGISGGDTVINEPNYSNAAWLYNSLTVQAMDYEQQVLGNKDSRHGLVAVDEETGHEFWARMQSGKLKRDNGMNKLSESVPNSDSAYAFIQLGSDIFAQKTNNAEWRTGIYGAFGSNRGTVLRGDDGMQAGRMNDSIYSVGLYANGSFDNGFYTDNVIQMSRHKFTTDTLQGALLTTRGTGVTISTEGGKTLRVATNLMVEPQLQYVWQSLDMEDGSDTMGTTYHSSNNQRHQLRTGLKIGNITDDNSLLSVWVKPSVIYNMGDHGKTTIGASGVQDSQVSFSPDKDGTALSVDTGVDFSVGTNGTLGVRGGYTESLKDSAVEEYFGQLNLKVNFK